MDGALQCRSTLQSQLTESNLRNDHESIMRTEHEQKMWNRGKYSSALESVGLFNSKLISTSKYHAKSTSTIT